MNMRINIYNSNSMLRFCGNNKQQVQSNTLLNQYAQRYCRGYRSPIIPDLCKYIEQTERVEEADIKGIIGHGGLSFVFDIGDNKVLKASLENPLEFRMHNRSFDIPFLSPVEKFGQTYFVKEPKADTKSVTVSDSLNVIKRIQNAGLEISEDFNKYKTYQVGKYNGKTYLLDTRCATPRPNRFSRFVYDFKVINSNIKKCIDFSAEEIAKRDERTEKNVKLFGPKYLHVDETPRPSVSFKRGLTIIYGVMKRNKNHGLPSVNRYGILECILKQFVR